MLTAGLLGFNIAGSQPAVPPDAENVVLAGSLSGSYVSDSCSTAAALLLDRTTEQNRNWLM